MSSCEGVCPHILGKTDYTILTSIAIFAGFLSIIGSALTIFMILRRRGLKSMRNRLVFTMSIIDLVTSPALGLFIIPSPPTDAWDRPISRPAFFIGGNNATCSAQGFFIQLSTAAPSYNAMLCLYYMAVIRYSVEESVLEKKFEVPMHLYASAPPLISSIASLALGLFKSTGRNCWLIHTPKKDEFIDVLIYMTTSFRSLDFIIIFISMFLTYLYVKESDNAMDRYRHNSLPSVPEQSFALRSTTYNQAMIFVLGLFVTYFWTAFIIILMNIQPLQDYPADFLLFLEYPQALFLPMQGVWHFIAFMRPNYDKLRKDRPDLTPFQALKLAIMEETSSQPTRRLSLVPSPDSVQERVAVRIPTLRNILDESSCFSSSSSDRGDDTTTDPEQQMMKVDENGRLVL